jgi:hypothetical protein
MKGLRLIDYAGIMAGSEDGPVVIPGNPDESLIVIVQSGEHFGHLDQAQLELVKQWIAEGAPENATSGGAAPAATEATEPAPSEATPEAATTTPEPPTAAPEATEPAAAEPTATQAAPSQPAFSWGGTSTPTPTPNPGFSWGD